MTNDAAEDAARRPRLTLGRVDRIQVQVGYRGRPDGPAEQHFMLDVTLPEPDTHSPAGALDESRILAALEPVLFTESDAPLHYSVHSHRWHTSWGPSPGALEIGVLVTTGPGESALSDAWQRATVVAFRDLLELLGRPATAPVSRDAAVLKARHCAATAYAVDADALSLSAEEHHPAVGSWTVGLRTHAGDEYDVVVGLVDGYAGSVRVRHTTLSEVFDSVGAE
ncbi:MAG TPA: hypothetical protein VFH10_11485 [Nocardioides sp.]|uniref:hypothetical protein n=1 Tax=Nocardioides sp. TaxID=35761 RepID=UPI002D7E1D4B|nr:hypothetical protein [Nocardioides sp.]HET6653255.1 hypothetical protein [Nocardioides sp.]